MNKIILDRLISLSAHINNFSAQNLKSCPFIIVSEFPRSGANWVRDMIGDCFQIPVPRFSPLPVTFFSLVHSHTEFPNRNIPTIYVYRDGRDVFVSHFWKLVNAVRTGNNSSASRILRYHPSLRTFFLNKNETLDSIVSSDVKHRFYSEWKSRPIGSRVNWGKHIDNWIFETENKKYENIFFARYEDFLNKPHESLITVCHFIANQNRLKNKIINPNSHVINFSVSRNSFKAKTGRDPGNINNLSNKRGGVSGEWKFFFDLELISKFKHDFGDTVLRLGYSWN